MKYSKLYGKKSNGTLKTWEIQVLDKKDLSEIIIEYGQLEGKKTISTRTIHLGKNIGKKNETTHYTQACSEAKSKWENQLKKEYFQDEESLNKRKDSMIILPMLAFNYKDRKHNLEYELYLQPKLDGVRGIFQKDSIYSRTGKEFYHLEHILEELKILGLPLTDGELYSHKNCNLSFQVMTGLIKKEKPNQEDLELKLQIKYYIYDIPRTDLDFNQRYNLLRETFKGKRFKYLELVEAQLIKSEDEILILHDKLTNLGYEGVMLRNKNGKYILKDRSKDLQKYKIFDDAEYRIIGFEKEEKGCLLWICQTKDGKKFKCVSKGSDQNRIELYKIGSKYIGKFLTVQYQGLSDDLVPRFPKSLKPLTEGIMDDIENRI